MINQGVTDNAGDVYCYKDGPITAGVPDTSADVRAIIAAGNNQTLMALYSVARNKTAFMLSFYSSLSKKTTATCTVRVYVRPFGGVFQLKHSDSISNVGSGNHDHVYGTPLKIESKSDIIMRADSNANDTGVSAGFDLILVEETGD